MEIVHVTLVFHDSRAQFIRFAVDEAALYPATRKP